MSRFKLGVVIFVLATALSTAAYAAKRGGGGGGHGGGWWRTWLAAVDMAAAVDMLAAVAATRALPAAVARVTSAPDRQYPVRLRVKVAHDKLAHQSIYRRAHSREQCRRPNDAAQFNRERNAQCKREPKPQI